MLERYLVFNARCRACTALAEIIRAASNDNLELIDIHSPLARRLLGQATSPHGWKFAPYLVVVRPDRVEAHTNWRGLIHLGWLLGPRGLWRVLRQARKRNLRILPRTRN